MKSSAGFVLIEITHVTCLESQLFINRWWCNVKSVMFKCCICVCLRLEISSIIKNEYFMMFDSLDHKMLLEIWNGFDICVWSIWASLRRLYCVVGTRAIRTHRCLWPCEIWSDLKRSGLKNWGAVLIYAGLWPVHSLLCVGLDAEMFRSWITEISPC